MGEVGQAVGRYQFSYVRRVKKWMVKGKEWASNSSVGKVGQEGGLAREKRIRRPYFRFE